MSDPPPRRTRWRRIVRWSMLAMLGVFALIQLLPANRMNPPVESDVNAPAEIDAILRKACYDCHSNETRWPWYGYVAPVSWWVTDHVHHARGDLNFSQWPTFDFDAQGHTLRDIAEQVRGGEMPLPSYTLIHSGARLSDEERQVLVEWATVQP